MSRFFQSSQLRSATAALAVALLAALPACSGGAGSVQRLRRAADAAPALQVLEPSQTLAFSRGGAFSVDFVASDREGDPEVQLFLDGDGNPATTGDRVPLGGRLRPVSGELQRLVFDSSRLPEGLWFVVAVARDARNAPVHAAAPARVEIRNAAFAVRAGGPGLDHLAGAVARADGSTVGAGYFTDVAVFGAGEPGETSLTSLGAEDVHVSAWDRDGALLWARRAGGSGADRAYAVTSAAGNGVFVGGVFRDRAVFGPGEAAETELLALDEADAFVARYASDGSLLWVRAAAGAGDQRVTAVQALADGSVVATGYFQDEIVFAAGTAQELRLGTSGRKDAFLVRYDSAGALLWAQALAGSGEESGLALAAALDGGFAVAGAFAVSLVLGADSPERTELFAMGGSDVLFARYAADGTLIWARSDGGLGDDAAVSLAALADGSFALVGAFQGSATFGRGEAGETTLVNLGGDDLFFARYAGADGSLEWVNGVGGIATDAARAVVALQDGGFLLAGLFGDRVVFGAGTAEETAFVSDGLHDSFLARFDAQGGLSWASRAGGFDKDGAFGIAVHADGSAVLAGRFRAFSVFGAGDARETLLTAAGDRDLYLARFNADGRF